MDLVYKILRPAEWASLRRDGVFAGSPDDRRDGFIHLSAEDQVAGTLARHFPGESGLVLAGIEAVALGEDLRWEVSRDGDSFPHLYADLPLSAVSGIAALALDGSTGRHVLPAELEPPLGS